MLNLKFNNLANKIISECSDSNIISEAVTVDDIRDMIKQMDKHNADTIRTLLFRDIKNLFSRSKYTASNLHLDDVKKVIYEVEDDDEFIRNFISSLSDKELNSKTIMSKLVDVILNEVQDTDVTKDDLLKVFQKANGDTYNSFSLRDNYETKKQYHYQQILRDIDASRITDDDIEVYTPETFKSYNRKAKGAFSYAIFLRGNLPIAIAHFFSDGTINYVKEVNYFSGSRTGATNIKNAIENSDKIIAISNEYRNNIKQRQPYYEKTDDVIRRENQDRRDNILSQRRKKRYKESVKNDIETLFNSIKEDLSPYKEKLMNIDAFDDDGDIAKAFIELKRESHFVKDALNDYLKYDYKSDSNLKDLVKNLKLQYLRLIELLEGEN
ncbi:MAG: hypothetical protein J6C46_00435 [Clostridia bacterium]|nr:hypothetical protein [Clostridia bacterium]